MKTEQKWPSIAFTRVGLLVVVPCALLFGSGLLALAATPVKMWNAGDTLTATDLNTAFSNIQSSMVDNSTDQTIGGVKTFTGAVVADPTYATGTTTTAFNTTSQTFVAIPGLVATIATHGKPVLVTVNTNHNTAAVPTTGGTSWAAWTVYRDGTNLGGLYGYQVTEHFLGMNIPVGFSFVDVPAAGTHSYVVEMRVGGANMSVDAGEGAQMQQIAAVEMN